MKRLTLFGLALFLSACSFAPLRIGVDDFFVIIPGNSRFNGVCYTRVGEAVDANFRSVTYEGDALFTPGQNVGVTKVDIRVYGRATDPDPSSDDEVKCTDTISAEDIPLSEDITLDADTVKRIEAGGSKLAELVTQDEYWLGAAAADDGLVSLSGQIDFTNGAVKAFF